MRQFYNTSAWDTYIISLFIFYLIDIQINLNTGFLTKGQLIVDRYQIAKKYLKQKLILDLLCMLAFIGTFKDLDILKLFILIKIQRISKFLNKLEYIYMININIYNAIQILRLFFLTIIICHISSIIYWFIGILNLDAGLSNWLTHYEYTSQDWKTTYLAAFYFQLTTISTVGYGDFLPISNNEKIFILFSMMFASAIFAYVLTCLGEILQEINRNKMQQKKDVLMLSKILDQKNISEDLKTQAINYLVYKNQNLEIIDNQDKDNYLDELPLNLKNSIILQQNIKILKDFKVFDIFSQEIQQSLAYKLKEEIISKNEIILHDSNKNKNEKQNNNYYKIPEKLYFINQGQINHCNLSENIIDSQQNSEYILQSYGKGSIIDINFFKEYNHINTVLKAYQNSQLFSITRKDMIKCLKASKKDYEIYRQIIDQQNFLYEKQYFKLLKCRACKMYSHVESQCRFIHFSPEITKIILQFNYSEQQDRNQYFERYFKFKFQSLSDQEIIQEQVYYLQEDYNLQVVDSYQNLSFSISQSQDSVISLSQETSDSSSGSEEENQVCTPKSMIKQLSQLKKLTFKYMRDSNRSYSQNSLNSPFNQNENIPKNKNNHTKMRNSKSKISQKNQNQDQCSLQISNSSINEKANITINNNNTINSNFLNNNNIHNNNNFQQYEKLVNKLNNSKNNFQDQKLKKDFNQRIKKRSNSISFGSDLKSFKFRSSNTKLEPSKHKHKKSTFFQEQNENNNNKILKLEQKLSINRESNNQLQELSKIQQQLQQFLKQNQVLKQRKESHNFNNGTFIQNQNNQEHIFYQNQDIYQKQILKYYKVAGNLNFNILSEKIKYFNKNFDKSFGKYTYFNYRKYQEQLPQIQRKRRKTNQNMKKKYIKDEFGISIRQHNNSYQQQSSQFQDNNSQFLENDYKDSYSQIFN